jgi:hypothetical protein
MGKAKALPALLAMSLAVSAAAVPPPGPDRVRDVLPAEGLIASSVVEFRRQPDLDPHYYLADETALGLDGRAEAVFARYRAAGGEALVLALAYPDPEAAARVQGRFGGDFFSRSFDPARGRFVEEIESGDFAGIARAGPVLVVVLEAPSREACDGLLRRLEERAGALRRPLDSGSRAGLS